MHESALKAKDYLEASRETAGPLSLFSIYVQRIDIRLEGTPLRFEDRCFVVLNFTSKTRDGKSIDDELIVVMLLDGTIADVQVVEGQVTFPFRAGGSTPTSSKLGGK